MKKKDLIDLDKVGKDSVCNIGDFVSDFRAELAQGKVEGATLPDAIDNYVEELKSEYDEDNILNWYSANESDRVAVLANSLDTTEEQLYSTIISVAEEYSGETLLESECIDWLNQSNGNAEEVAEALGVGSASDLYNRAVSAMEYHIDDEFENASGDIAALIVVDALRDEDIKVANRYAFNLTVDMVDQGDIELKKDNIVKEFKDCERAAKNLDELTL